MKKLTHYQWLLAFFFLFYSLTGFTQRSPGRLWKGGQLDAHFGIGLVSTFSADKARTLTPPITFSAEYLFNEKVSIGLQYGYSVAEKNREALGQKVNWRNNFHTISLRTGFHYTRIERWDLYGGLAFSHSTSKITMADLEKKDLEANLGIQESSSQFSYTAFLGSRYAIDKRMSIFAEAGFLTSIITAGFGYRLL